MLTIESRGNRQRTLDVFWLVHNFARVHCTTKVVPAVKLGILETGLSWSQLLTSIPLSGALGVRNDLALPGTAPAGLEGAEGGY